MSVNIGFTKIGVHHGYGEKSIDSLLTAKGPKARVKQGGGLFAIVCLAIVVLGGTGLSAWASQQQSDREQVAEMISANYIVDGIGMNVRTTGFTGHTFAISTGGIVHTCGGITKDDAQAKKPLSCTDGTVVTAKK